MNFEQAISIFGLLGLGGLLKSALDFLISNEKSKSDSKQNFKETRYKAIILLCYSVVFYSRDAQILQKHRSELDNLTKLKNEIHTEFINMALFASDDVIVKMKNFIKNENITSLNALAFAMRKDLYSIKTKLNNNFFEL